MIQNYLTSASRNFKNNKVNSLINMVGLGLGIMVSILALMFVLDELGFDKFHTKRERLYRLNKVNFEPDGGTSLTAESSGMMGPMIVQEFPEVEKAVRYLAWFDDVVLTREDKNVMLHESDLAFADSTFFGAFDFGLLSGNPNTALARPNTIVLTEKVAEGLFGKQDPIGKTVIGMAGKEYEVTGIVERAPRNSHIQYEALVSWTTYQSLGMEWMNNWIAQGICTYILLKDGADGAQLQAKFPKFMSDHLPTRVDKYKLYLQPFNEIYLSNNVTNNRIAKAGNRQFV